MALNETQIISESKKPKNFEHLPSIPPTKKNLDGLKSTLGLIGKGHYHELGTYIDDLRELCKNIPEAFEAIEDIGNRVNVLISLSEEEQIQLNGATVSVT